MVTDKYKVGQKVKVIHTVPTVNGTLYEGEICIIEGITYPDKDLCVKDSLGRKWYIDFCDISPI